MSRRTWLYPLFVGLFILLIAGITREADRRLTPGHAPRAETAERPVNQTLGPRALWERNAQEPLAILILQILVVAVVARVFGGLARRLGQPTVMGEIAAGIALGPSLLGAVAPDTFTWIFPRDSLGGLYLLSQVGVLLFMFTVGLDVHWSHVRKQAQSAVAVSHISILVPFLLGVLAAISLYDAHAPAGIPFQAFGLFMGIAMSITAFPVLARILDERGLTTTPLGSTALTCAAVDDVTAWTLLAFVVAVVTAGGALSTLVATVLLAVAVAAIMIGLVRPAMGRLLTAHGQSPFTRANIAIVVCVLFASALATEIIGVHALFGAFIAGAVMPPDATIRNGLRERLESFSAVFLLPLFFAYTGLRTEIGLLDTPSAWLMCLALIGLATIGKLGASAVTARVTGMSWRDSFLLGALMNTRGLMELIALNVGLDLGVISPEIFAALVLMALVTTTMTGPLVDFVRRHET